MTVYGSGISTSGLAGVDVSVTLTLPENVLESSWWGRQLAAELPKMAGEARDFWISEAGRRLKSSRHEYQKAIELQSLSGNSFSLSLGGEFLPQAVELGTEEYDMKPGLAGKIVPLNVDRQVVFSSPKVFRMCRVWSDGWIHPGFEGANIRDAVAEEITEVLLPKYIQRVLEAL